MATLRQKKALDNLVENGGVVSRAMIDAGYSAATAKTPQKLTESKSFKQLMEQYGLTDELLLTSLVDDIKSKPGKRHKELELGFKVGGRFIEQQPSTNQPVPILTVIQVNNGGEEATITRQEVESSSGGDISLQDDRDTPMVDRLRPA